MMKRVLFSVLIIAIGIAFICIRVFSSENGEMKSMHVHDSKHMKERGIHCVIDQDKEDRMRAERVSRKLHNGKNNKQNR